MCKKAGNRNSNDIMGYLESNNYQDIENKINELGLRPPGEWTDPDIETIWLAIHC